MAAVGAAAAKRALLRDYSVAVHSVRMRRRPPNDLIELTNFDGELPSFYVLF